MVQQVSRALNGITEHVAAQLASPAVVVIGEVASLATVEAAGAADPTARWSHRAVHAAGSGGSVRGPPAQDLSGLSQIAIATLIARTATLDIHRSLNDRRGTGRDILVHHGLAPPAAGAVRSRAAKRGQIMC